MSKVIAQDDLLDDNNPKKGAVLKGWLMKRDVVFARTSPEQKLIIVENCQRLSHVVAVTGDGVNDSPALKKADIGVAMGKAGTDVAKDASDILLLDDHFPNILSGVKEGRALFDVLRKIIIYNLTSNSIELIPFLGYIILQYPSPMTTIFVLCMDCFSNIYPMISFAGEFPEANIMKRKPRNSKKDKLCTLKGYSWAYVFEGVVGVCAPFLCFFAAFNDYGFSPSNLFFFVNSVGIAPSAQDFYNPYDIQYLGNSNGFILEHNDLLGIKSDTLDVYKANQRTFDYSGNLDYNIDMRIAFYWFPSDFWGECQKDSRGVSYDGPVCYHIEAHRHAQSAFILALVIIQTMNATICRTISTSSFKHIFSNMNLNMAYLIEVAFMLIIVYCPVLNYALGTRSLLIEHIVPCALWFIVWFSYSEFTKYLIRNVNSPDGKAGFFYEYFYY